MVRVLTGAVIEVLTAMWEEVVVEGMIPREVVTPSFFPSVLFDGVGGGNRVKLLSK